MEVIQGLGDSRSKIRALRARFDAAHVEGLAALKRRDYAALDYAIRTEQTIIEEQIAIIEGHFAVLAELRRRLRFPTPGSPRARLD